MVSGKIDDHITVEFEPGIQPDTEFNFANFCQSPDQRLVTVKRIILANPTFNIRFARNFPYFAFSYLAILTFNVIFTRRTGGAS